MTSNIGCGHCGRPLDVCDCGVDYEMVYRPQGSWNDDDIGPINGHRKSEAFSAGCFTVFAMGFSALLVIGFVSMLFKFAGRG